MWPKGELSQAVTVAVPLLLFLTVRSGSRAYDPVFPTLRVYLDSLDGRPLADEEDLERPGSDRGGPSGGVGRSAFCLPWQAPAAGGGRLPSPLTLVAQHEEIANAV